MKSANTARPLPAAVATRQDIRLELVNAIAETLYEFHATTWPTAEEIDVLFSSGRERIELPAATLARLHTLLSRLETTLNTIVVEG